MIYSIGDYHLIGSVQMYQGAKIDEFDLLYLFLVLVKFNEDVLRSHIAIHHVHLLNLLQEEAYFLNEHCDVPGAVLPRQKIIEHRMLDVVDLFGLGEVEGGRVKRLLQTLINVNTFLDLVD